MNDLPIPPKPPKPPDQTKPKKSNKKKKPDGELGTILTGRPPGGASNDQLERVLLSKGSPVDLDELAIELYRQMNGAKGFAAKLMLDMDDNLKSPLRTRVMDLILRILSGHAVRNSVKDTDLATDEELESRAIELMRKIGMEPPRVYEWPNYYVI